MLKLLLTIAVIAAAWYFFKSRKRITREKATKFGRALEAARDAMADSARARNAGDTASETPKSGSQVAVDLKPCPKCGAYVAEGTTCSCTKA